MRDEALDAVIGLRRRAVDESRRSLAASLDAVTLASRGAAEAEFAIEREADRAADPASGDALVEAFSRWLPGARRRVEAARRAQDDAEAEAARCRAELAATRLALETVEQLRAERTAARPEHRAAQERGEADDLMLSRHPADVPGASPRTVLPPGPDTGGHRR